jgi:hypothetical protein
MTVTSYPIQSYILGIPLDVKLLDSKFTKDFEKSLQPQLIFSQFIIILNGYFHIFSSTIIRNYSYIIILTCVTYDIFPPFKPCGIWHVSLTPKLPCQKTQFRIFLFRDLPPGINFLVSLLMQALISIEDDDELWKYQLRLMMKC